MLYDAMDQRRRNIDLSYHLEYKPRGLNQTYIMWLLFMNMELLSFKQTMGFLKDGFGDFDVQMCRHMEGRASLS